MFSYRKLLAAHWQVRLTQPAGLPDPQPPPECDRV